MTSRDNIALLLEILRLGRGPPPSRTEETADRWSAMSASPGLACLIRYEGAELWLYRRLRELGIPSAPRFEEELRQAAYRDTIRGLRIDDETVAVLTLFGNAGIPCVLIKGQARRAATSLYPWANARSSSDVDLLLPADRAQQGWDLLQATGYVPAVDPLAFGTTHHLMPVWSSRRVAVELHLSTSSRVTPEEAWRRATDRADQLTWSGLPVTVPSATELLWHGLAHAFHAYHFPAATRLRSLLDGAAILAPGGVIDWEGIRSRIHTTEVRGKGGGTDGDFVVPPELQLGWLGAAATLAGVTLPPALEVTRSLPMGTLLHWRHTVHQLPVGRAARGRLLEEAARCELHLPVTPSPPAVARWKRARRAVGSAAARACYRTWRTLSAR